MSTPAAEAVTPDMTDPNSTQMYINNLSFNTTVEGLISFFQQKLTLTPQDVNIVMNKYNGRSKGFGFLRVPKDKVQAACSLSGSILDEREVKVVEAIVRSPEERQAERDARDARRKETSAKRKEERAAAQAAANPNPTSSSPTSSSPPAERRPRAPRPERKVYDNATQLYVSNLSYDVTKEKLKEMVDEAIGGESLEVDIVMRRIGKFKGRSRGYGFVTVPNDKVDKGLALNGRELEGRVISVVVAKERKPEEEGQGGDGAAAPADGEEKEAGQAPRRRTRPPRRRGPRAAGGAANGGDPSKDEEAVAAASEGTTVAAGSSAPTPQQSLSNGAQTRGPMKKPRKPKNAAAAPAVDVGGTTQ